MLTPAPWLSDESSVARLTCCRARLPLFCCRCRIGGDSQVGGRVVGVAVGDDQIAERRAGRVGEHDAVAGRVDRGRDSGRLVVDRRDDIAERFRPGEVDAST